MTGLLVTWFVSAVAFLITAYFVPGFQVTGLLPALAAAAVLGLVNVLVRPLLVLLTLPVTFLTLGFFLLVINALCILLASAITPGFVVAGFGYAFIGAIVLSVVTWALASLVGPGLAH